MTSPLLNASGGPLTVGGATLTHPYLLHEPFTGADNTLPAAWTDGHAYNTTYAPLSILTNTLTCNDPTNNTNTGEQSPGYPYDGIGCIWRDMGVVDISATLRVTGLDTSYREATPLLHVTPGTSRHGLGAWLSTPSPPAATTNGVLLVGYIANPASDFGIQPTPGHQLAVGGFTRTATTTLTMRSVGGNVTCIVNGSPITLTWIFGGTGTTATFPVDASLSASTKHGIAVDNHFQATPAPLITDAWFASI